MNIPQIIFEQLGGGRFALMTGSNMFIGEGHGDQDDQRCLL